MVTDRTLSQESSQEQEQESADCDVLAANSNNSNSQEYVTPVPSYGTKVNRSYAPTSAISENTSMWRNSHFYPPSTQNAQSAVSQVTPISANTWTNIHNGTSSNNSSTPHTRQSCSKDHPQVSSVSSRANSKRGVTESDSSANTAKRHYGTPASLDLLRRIQLHNKAISHYIEMQRQHQTPPLSVHQPSSSPATDPSRFCHSKKQPTPTSSEYHDCTSTSAPSFKFVVPHPPSTPKPNFTVGSHRGVIRTTPVSM